MKKISEQKQIFREKFTKIRNSLKNIQDKSNIIANKVIDSETFKKAKVIAIYKSFKSEVDTTKLIDYSIESGKIVALPKVVNDELKFYKINSLKDTFIKSSFEVEEPKENEENFISKDQIDLVIVPGLCFDREHNRLGYGKGYYDRFLMNGKFNIIGICFKEQILNGQLLPTDKNDFKVEQIITDE